MSGALLSHDDKPSRNLRPEEMDLIRKALGPSTDLNLDTMKVVDANDGGMGGIRFEIDRSPMRVFGSELVRLSYIDSDGIPVSITLNSDMHGDLFEIDFWKIDFSALITYPRGEQLISGDP